MRIAAFACFSLLFVCAASCILPNTSQDPFDPYAAAIRLMERGEYSRAAAILGPLAEKGDCDAEYRLGMFSFRGWGVQQDRQKAVELWRKAANGNHPKAQGAMADLHFQNPDLTYNYCGDCGVERNLVQAYFWYLLMQQSSWYSEDKKYADTMLKTLVQELTPAQVEEAKSQAARWRAVPQDCKPRHWW